MSIPEETLMAYVDGELDPAARTELEAAMRRDPTIEKRIAQHRELRTKIELAYAEELTLPVPDRLLAAVRGAPDKARPNVVQFDEARAAAVAAYGEKARKSRWRLAVPMAASFLLCVGLGFFAWRQSDSILIQASRGALVAGGTLARGLSNQLAGDRSSTSPVEIGLSFIAKSGDYCRTFAILGDASSAGLACRHSNRWEIRVLSESAPLHSGGSQQFRTAGSAMPPAVLHAVEEQISGEPLDRSAEMAARQQQWQSTGH
jgi:hypothetical protein